MFHWIISLLFSSDGDVCDIALSRKVSLHDSSNLVTEIVTCVPERVCLGMKKDKGGENVSDPLGF